MRKGDMTMVWFQLRHKDSSGAAVVIKEKKVASRSKFGGLTRWPCCNKPFSEEEIRKIREEVTDKDEYYCVEHEHDCRWPRPKVYFCRDGDEIFYKRYEL